jgi:solute carrier family 25 carnitine/acylcarnitine transporter 20/29
VQIALAGVGVALVLATFCIPVELVMIQQQRMKAEGMEAHEVPSAWEVAKRIHEQHGLRRGLYRGAVAFLLRDVPGYPAYFVTYEAVNRAFTPLSSSLLPSASTATPTPGGPWWSPLLAGALAGVIGWLVTFPFDLIKTRMQGSCLLDDAPPPEYVTDGRRPKALADQHPYLTVRSTVEETYAAGGWRAFWDGVVPCLVRAIPVEAVNFGVYQCLLAWFS